MTDDYSDIGSVQSDAIRDHNKHVINPPEFTSRAIKKYIKTRFTTLFVPKLELAQYSKQEIFNPFKPLMELSLRQWNFFFIGMLAWTWDAFDYFTVSLNMDAIAETLQRDVSDISWAITLVLMFRTVGAVIFGFIGDRYGTKIPYCITLGLLIVLQIGCGFIQTYPQFLAVRALFGIVMGGLYGPAVVTALQCPKSARGIVLGLYQQGWALGYLLAVIFQRAIVYNSSEGWRALFWFSAGPPVLFIIWRLMLPEVDTFIEQQQKLAIRKKLQHENSTQQEQENKSPLISDDFKKVLKTYWLILIYCVFLMSGFNFSSHGSQDLFPTLLTAQLGYGSDRSTVTNSVANLGAIFGGFVFGHASTFVGRRLTIIIASIIGGAMIYPWAFVRNSGINAGVFFLQMGVQGAWGVVPIHLSELAPPSYRTFVVGVSYQLGNLCSSASSTIESTIGERFPIVRNGKHVFNYSKVMAIFMGCVFGYLILITFVGPENRNADFDVDRDEYVDDLYDIGNKSDDDSDEEAGDDFGRRTEPSGPSGTVDRTEAKKQESSHVERRNSEV